MTCSARHEYAEAHLCAANRSASPRLALVVDDSGVNRKIATILLRSLGFDVRQACNGLEAIWCCTQEQFDLIVMDVVMPGGDGLTCTRIIRNDKLQRPAAVILGWSTAASPQQCSAVGMNGVLPKPLNVTSLVDALQTSSLVNAS